MRGIDMTVLASNPRVLFFVNSSSQVEMFDSIRKELADCASLAVTVDWYFREARDALKDVSFPFRPIETYGIGKIETAIEREKPDIIVVGSDQRPVDQEVIRVSNSRGIPTLMVQSGILPDRGKINPRHSYGPGLKWIATFPVRFLTFIMSRRFSFHEKIGLIFLELLYGARGKLGIYGHGDYSKAALFGNAVREMLVSEGVDSKRLVVTGSPKFDRISQFRYGNFKQEFCERWNLPIDMEIILLITQGFVGLGIWDVQQNRKFVRAIARAITALPGTQLIVKLHPPGENENDYGEIVKDIILRPILCKYTSLLELVSASSLVITVSSTAALEAMALGKPVMIINLFDDQGASFFKDSGAMYIRREQDILPGMMRALSDLRARTEMARSMKKFVHAHAYLQDGRASKRIARLIESMIASKNLHRL